LLAITVTGDVPPGLAVEIGANTVAVGGVPSVAGQYQLQINLRDVNGAALQGDFTIKVSPHSLSQFRSFNLFITDNETFSFSDAENVFFPVVISDNENFTFTNSLSVGALTVPVILWATPVAIYYGTALSGTQLDASSTVAGTFVYSPPSGTVLPVRVNTLSVVFTPADPTHYTTATASVLLTVSKTPQTITFPAFATQVALTSVGLTATASSGLAVTYASTTPTVCSVSGTTASSLISGSCSIVATQAGNGAYSAAFPVYRSFWVSHATQTITFPAIATPQVAVTSVGLTATASSSLAVTFTSTTPTVCSVSGTTASSLISGSCTIEATQVGNGAYGAATPVYRSFWVNHATQTITFPTIPAQVELTSLGLSATASSGLTVSFASTTPAICTVSGTTASLLTPGTCTIQATQAGGAVYSPAPTVNQSFAVTSATPQTITFPAIATQVALTSVGLTATASSGLTVHYASTTPTICSVAGTMASSLLSGNCIIQATQAGNTVYAAAPAISRAFWINHAPQTITFPAIATPQVALTGVNLTAAASSGLAVSYVSTTPTYCTVSGSTAMPILASETCTIEATQAGNGAYGPATPVSHSFWVNHATQTITFPTIPTQTGVSSLSLSATASSGLTVSFASVTPTVCTVAGTTASLLINGTCGIQATQAGNTVYGPAPLAGVSFTVVSP
jgi:hypothetical protein